ncbi:subtilisin-like protein, partial [Saccharata proteae CBS 121410]
VLHEKRDLSRASDLVKMGDLAADMVLPVRIGLKQSNLHLGPGFLRDVAHPASPNFGKHWTLDEVVDKFAPSTESIDSVRHWLVSDGGINVQRLTLSDNKAWFAFDATVTEMESLLHTKYHKFRRSSDDAMLVGCDEYHIPRDVQKHIDFITPGVKLEQLHTGKVNKRNPDLPNDVFQQSAPEVRPKDPLSLNGWDCSLAMIAPCYRALYGLPQLDLGKTVNPNNTLGLYEPNKNTYIQHDLDLFYNTYAPYIPQGYHPIIKNFYGAHTPNPPNTTGPKYAPGEETLDVTLPMSLVYPQDVTVYHQGPIGGTSFIGGLFSAIDGSYCTRNHFNETVACPHLDPPKVISVSYGMGEGTEPSAWQDRTCNEILKLGLRGTTFLCASGDAGVGPDKSCNGDDHTGFLGSFPVSCPWATAVGATKFTKGGNATMHEKAIQFSGGGFSNVYEAPDYQTDAINRYFDVIGGSPYPYYEGAWNANKTGRFNRRGRGFPDVSANGLWWNMFLNGNHSSVAGTSQSIPAFAAVVNLLNEELVRPIGFLNYILYENPQVMKDITIGHNPGCHTDGFFTAEGWDPVSGLGTPDFPAMLSL